MEQYQLPDGWVWAKIGDISQVNPQMSWPHGLLKESEISFVPMAAVDDVRGEIAAAETRPISDVWKGYKRFAEGDVIFARITPCMENGKAAIARDLVNGIGLGSTEFIVLRPSQAVLAEWLYYFVRQPRFRDDAAHAMTGTAGQLRVPPSYLAESDIPLPPHAEQRRIVTRMEQLLAQRDTARAALDTLPPLLKKVRRRILADAFAGRLTQRCPTDEPASVLLERIQAERRRRSAELIPHSKAKYEAPAPPDVSNLPELPKGWVWTTPDAIASPDKYALAIGPFGSNLVVNDYQTEGVPLIFVRNIRSGIFGGNDTKFVTLQKAEELKAHRVDGGDILITKMGEPPGDACLYPESRPFAITTSDCIKWQLSGLLPERKLFVHMINSQVIRNQVIKITRGVAQQKISLTRFKSIAVPLPPLEEQQRIFTRIESLFAQVEAIEAAVEVVRRRVEQAEQAILSRAFRGELVAQDAGDEPAVVLQERIKTGRGVQN